MFRTSRLGFIHDCTLPGTGFRDMASGVRVSRGLHGTSNLAVSLITCDYFEPVHEAAVPTG